MSDFFGELDRKEAEGRIARIFADRPANLHNYQGCANDSKMQSAPAPAPDGAGEAKCNCYTAFNLNRMEDEHVVSLSCPIHAPEAKPPTPAPSVEGAKHESTYFIATENDGLWSLLVPESSLKQGVHDFMCVCKLPWEQCGSAGVPDIVRLLDDADEWTGDSRIPRFNWHQDFEDGYIRATLHVAPLSALPANPPASEDGAGLLFHELYERSKFDNSIIVGSEVREVIGALRGAAEEIASLRATSVCPNCSNFQGDAAWARIPLAASGAAAATEAEVESRRIVEDYIASLVWSREAKDWEKTLVAGNLRGFWTSLLDRGLVISTLPPVPVGMMQVSEAIAYFKRVLVRFGDSCVYIRTAGVSWGAVALNRKHADEIAGGDSPEILLRTEKEENAAYRERVGPIVTRLMDAEAKLAAAEAKCDAVMVAVARFIAAGSAPESLEAFWASLEAAR